MKVTFQLSLATARSIVLENLEFEASGSYYCEVTLESPIFTQVSEIRELLVIRKYGWVWKLQTPLNPTVSRPPAM